LQNEFTRNDGIIHGKFLRRCNLPGLDRTNFQSQLKVGSTIDIYGRKVMLYACDDATRGFFESLGVSQPENFEPPVDAFTEKTVSLT
jgi:EF-hand domain-containing protein 1